MLFFILEAGTSTVSCFALFALRMRVSISATGSVICIWVILLFLELRPAAASAARYRGQWSSPLARGAQLPMTFRHPVSFSFKKKKSKRTFAHHRVRLSSRSPGRQRQNCPLGAAFSGKKFSQRKLRSFSPPHPMTSGMGRAQRLSNRRSSRLNRQFRGEPAFFCLLFFLERKVGQKEALRTPGISPL